MNYPLYRDKKRSELHFRVWIVDEDGNTLVKGRAVDAEEAQGLVERLDRYVEKHLLEEYERLNEENNSENA